MNSVIKKKQFLNSNYFKLAMVLLIIVLLLIPMGMVEGLVVDRKIKHKTVANEISNLWGGSQTLVGPFLEVPYEYEYLQYLPSKSKNVIKRVKGSVIFLPDDLNINGNLKPDYRRRGIYKIVVYRGKFKIAGTFGKLDVSDLDLGDKRLKNNHLKWERASLQFYLADIKGVINNPKIIWNLKPFTVKPVGIYSSSRNVSYQGFMVRLRVDSMKLNNFSFALDLKGSPDINFIPFGKSTHITLKSEWPSPKFTGSYLPDKHSITEKGFNASWYISQLNRPLPQAWLKSNTPGFSTFKFGTRLIEPVNKYLQTLRAVKYSVLFILLSFITLFFVELFTKNETNILQYLLTGLALVLFYSILLSLSEQMSFGLAYLISTVSIIGLISAYNYNLTKKLKPAFVLFFLWSVLYGFLYFILQLEDLALLAGNIGLFVILAAIMFTSKRFSVKSKSEKQDSETGDFIVDRGDSL